VVSKCRLLACWVWLKAMDCTPTDAMGVQAFTGQPVPVVPWRPTYQHEAHFDPETGADVFPPRARELHRWVLRCG
jgi:hypothetical protein